VRAVLCLPSLCASPQDEFTAPLPSWSPATLSRWCAAQGDALRTSRGVDVGRILEGMTGNELSQMSDFGLDELGVPARMRAYLRDKLLAPPAAPPVDEQVAAAGAWRAFTQRLSEAANALFLPF
jgi:hypothetical protein